MMHYIVQHSLPYYTMLSYIPTSSFILAPPLPMMRLTTWDQCNDAYLYLETLFMQGMSGNRDLKTFMRIKLRQKHHL